MAEFQEVIEQFKRLCDSANQDCSNCGLKGMSCSIKDITDNPLEFEKCVMSWAAECSEPVYPSWWEYLRAYSVTGANIPDSAVIYKLKNWRIPAEIAEKLGVEPVSVVHGDCGATNDVDAWKKLGIEPKEV